MAETPTYVLDSFPVIALVQEEPGADRVERLLIQSEAGHVALHMCSVNVAEVFYNVRRRATEQVARTTVAGLQLAGVRFHDATLALSLRAGALKAQFPISLGDCYAAALAQELDATLVTGDPEFRHVEDVVRIEWLV